MGNGHEGGLEVLEVVVTFRHEGQLRRATFTGEDVPASIYFSARDMRAAREAIQGNHGGEWPAGEDRRDGGIVLEMHPGEPIDLKGPRGGSLCWHKSTCWWYCLIP